MYFIELTDLAIECNASDMHLTRDEYIAFRQMNGDLVFDSGLRKPQDSDLQDLFKLLPGQGEALFQRHKRLDAAIEVKDGRRMRLRLSKHSRGWSLACRLLPAKIRTLEEIEAPPVLQDILHVRSGLVIVAGPTGEGKTTTLAAMVDKINRTQQLRVATAENPIEYVHESRMSLITQKEIPRDVASYEDAMLDGLREDLDVILLSELREPRELRAAVTAADTGLLVLATLHARNGPGAVQRLVDAFPTGEKDLARSMIADSMRLFVAQALVKTSDGQGRIGVFETMVNTPAVRNLIRTGELAQLESAIQTGGQHGMMTLKQSMSKLMTAGRVSVADGEPVLRGRNSDR